VNEITQNNVPAELNRKILTAIRLKKDLEQYESEIKAELTQAMIDNNLVSIKNDDYTVTLATRASYRAIGDIPAQFQKTVLDTTKVGTHAKLYGETPDGIEKNETKYIVWRSK
jgi:hypothetical protein